MERTPDSIYVNFSVPPIQAPHMLKAGAHHIFQKFLNHSTFVCCCFIVVTCLIKHLPGEG